MIPVKSQLPIIVETDRYLKRMLSDIKPTGTKRTVLIAVQMLGIEIKTEAADLIEAIKKATGQD